MTTEIKVSCAGTSYIAEGGGQRASVADSPWEPADAAWMLAVKLAGRRSLNPDNARDVAMEIGVTCRHVNSTHDEEIFEASIPNPERPPKS